MEDIQIGIDVYPRKAGNTTHTLVNIGAPIQAAHDLPCGLLEKWGAYIDRQPQTVKTYTKNAARFLEWLMERGIDQPTRETVLEYKHHLKDKGYKASTRRGYIVAIKQLFQWAAREGLYQDITQDVRGVKVDPTHRGIYFTPGQALQILDSIDRETLIGKRDYALLSLLFTTGMRTVEIERANIGDLQPLAGRTVLYFQGKGKEDKGDYKKIEPPIEAAIRAYLLARGEKDPGAPLFASLHHHFTGGRLATRAIRGIISRRYQAAGFIEGRYTAHSTRHTAAMTLIEAGADIREVQSFMGHSSILTTMHYVDEAKRSKSRAESSITAAIFGAHRRRGNE